MKGLRMCKRSFSGGGTCNVVLGYYGMSKQWMIEKELDSMPLFVAMLR
jgi:hypothetical protein